MKPRERATLTMQIQPEAGQMEGSRARRPDDPKLRVDLTLGFRDELCSEKRASVAAGVRSPRAKAPKRQLDPSTVSRYARGVTAPTLLTARRLAQALRKPLDEIVTGFTEHYARPTVAWARHVLFVRAYRSQVLQILDAFEIVLRHVHLGVVSDAKRGVRHVTRPDTDCAAYRVVDVTFEQPLSELAGTDIILTYRLMDRPPVFVDYGAVCIEADRVVAHELWTRRGDAASLAGSGCRLRIRTWIDGRVTDFLVRSARPFTVGPMHEPDEAAEGSDPVVTFRPGGIHRSAPPGV